VPFLSTDNIDYIDEVIPIVLDRLNVSGIGLSSFPVLHVLLTFLCVRPQRCHNGEDVDEFMQLFPTVVNDKYRAIPTQFEISFRCAQYA